MDMNLHFAITFCIAGHLLQLSQHGFHLPTLFISTRCHAGRPVAAACPAPSSCPTARTRAAADLSLAATAWWPCACMEAWEQSDRAGGYATAFTHFVTNRHHTRTLLHFSASAHPGSAGMSSSTLHLPRHIWYSMICTAVLPYLGSSQL